MSIVVCAACAPHARRRGRQLQSRRHRRRPPHRSRASPSAAPSSAISRRRSPSSAPASRRVRSTLPPPHRHPPPPARWRCSARSPCRTTTYPTGPEPTTKQIPTMPPTRPRCWRASARAAPSPTGSPRCTRRTTRSATQRSAPTQASSRSPSDLTTDVADPAQPQDLAVLQHDHPSRPRRFVARRDDGQQRVVRHYARFRRRPTKCGGAWFRSDQCDHRWADREPLPQCGLHHRAADRGPGRLPRHRRACASGYAHRIDRQGGGSRAAAGQAIASERSAEPSRAGKPATGRVAARCPRSYTTWCSHRTGAPSPAYRNGSSSASHGSPSSRRSSSPKSRHFDCRRRRGCRCAR